MNEWLSSLRPGAVLKWGGVVLAYLLGILFLVNVIAATVEAWG